MVYQAKKPRKQSDTADSTGESNQELKGSEEMKEGQQNTGGPQMPFYTNAVQMNLC